MNFKAYILIVITLSIYCIPNSSKAYTINNSNLSNQNVDILVPEEHNVPPVAIDDTIIHHTGCGRNTIIGNVLANDYSRDGDKIGLYFINPPKIGPLYSEKDGSFRLKIPDGFTGLITFEYYVMDLNERGLLDYAEVLVYVLADNDCDDVCDDIDLDNDNDGLLNCDEGNGTIDSDNDGVTDIIEWQEEGFYKGPSLIDLNKNGWDDRYDIHMGGGYSGLADTDNDGVADYVDEDSNEDGVSDLMESTSSDIDKSILSGIDTDNDGLDDIFDNIGCWLENRNACGSNALLKDSNNNGIRDWRDFIDDQDNNSTYFAYPNPANGYLSVSYPNLPLDKLIKISIYDITGKLLVSTETTVHQKINVSDLQDGIYVVKIRFDECLQTQQIIVKH